MTDVVNVLVRMAPVFPADAAPAAVALLSEAERARADRFRSPASRDSYITAHALVRYSLSERTGVRPQDWEFKSEQSGRPVVAAPLEYRHLRFSLTHCAGLAACAVADAVDVGIDAEDDGRRMEVESLLRYFAGAERAAVLEAPHPERGELFLRYWTLKESYVKALGDGLSTETLAGVSFIWDARGIAIPAFSPPCDGQAADWFFRTWRRAPFILACAVHAASSEVVLDQREIDVRAFGPTAGSAFE